jgi:serine/threonine-protein kinase HipA
MTLAGRAGITTAETQVIHLAGANAIAVRRFDREPGRRIHSISAETAIRAATASGDEPEMGYPELARILRRVGVTQGDLNQKDARELFRRMVFNILVDNTDDHEKNHSLLVVNLGSHGRMKLSSHAKLIVNSVPKALKMELTSSSSSSFCKLQNLRQ